MATKAPRLYTFGETWEPEFRVDVVGSGATAMCQLFVQTFDKSLEHEGHWLSRPRNRWVLLAQISSDLSITFPVHLNPDAQRYLSPKHGSIVAISKEHHALNEIPDTAAHAIEHLEGQFTWPLYCRCVTGMGLSPKMLPVWLGLLKLGKISSIVVTRNDNNDAQMSGDKLEISEFILENIRRAFDRSTRAYRRGAFEARLAHVRSVLLHRLDPKRFPKIVQVAPDGRLLETRAIRETTSKASARATRQSAVSAVKNSAKTISEESPVQLLELHSEIERVTLATMIEKFEGMLQKQLPEAKWQKFFEANLFILTMIFCRPVRLLQTQFHAAGSGLDGSGAQVGDFLLGESGLSLALVEIKTPKTKLMLESAYRNGKVYGPSSDLSGALTQVLFQRAMLHERWSIHQMDTPNLRDSRPDTTRCVVIAGQTNDDEDKQRSFDIFRDACKDVDIVTFDELLGKLKLLLAHLTPPSKQSELPPF